MTQSAQKLATKKAAEQESDRVARLVDLRLQWLEDRDSDAVILDVGGVWDRKLKRWHGDGSACQIVRMHPGQYRAAYWFAEWLRYYVSGAPRPPELEHVWTMLLAGGRRGGKSDLLEKILLTSCIAKPRGIVWGVSPAEEETEELHQALDYWIPESWAIFRGTKGGGQWRFAHGSRLTLRSAHNPAALKRGRVDVCGLNEMQNMAKKAYTMVRAPVADRGGIVVGAMNPPDRPIGRWCMEKYEEAQSGSSTLALFEFDPEQNPYIEMQSLLDMRHDVGELDYRREVLGEFIEIGDLVWYAWSPRHNVRPLPELARDVTREFTRRMLGRPFDFAIGIDLQLTPHMSAAVGEFFEDPELPDDPLCWFTDEFIVEGDEFELIDAIESRLDADGGQVYTPENTALIVDASAWWQDAERTKGRGSIDMFRSRGWRYFYRPDSAAKRNPHIFERCLAANARFRSASGRRAAFSVPENVGINTALKRWENKNGIPHRRSEYAHVSDSCSYLLNRFYPRKLRGKHAGAVGYSKVDRRRSRRERDLDHL